MKSLHACAEAFSYEQQCCVQTNGCNINVHVHEAHEIVMGHMHELYDFPAAALLLYHAACIVTRICFYAVQLSLVNCSRSSSLRILLAINQ